MTKYKRLEMFNRIEQELKDYTKRKHLLSIPRYNRMNNEVLKTKVTFPMSVYEHSHFELPGMFSILYESLQPFIRENNVNIWKLGVGMFIHDDIELLKHIGDVPLNEKYLMSEEKKKFQKQCQMGGLITLATSDWYPKEISGYNTHKILWGIEYKTSVESQLISFIDKRAGLAEAMHNLFHGNLIFLEPVINYHVNEFSNPEKYFPRLAKLFQNPPHEFFNTRKTLDIFEFSVKCMKDSYTAENILLESGIPYYDVWKNAIIHNLPNGKKRLVEVIEQKVVYH